MREIFLFALLCVAEAYLYDGCSSLSTKSSLSSRSFYTFQTSQLQFLCKKSSVTAQDKRPATLFSQMSLVPNLGRRASLIMIPLILLGPNAARGDEDSARRDGETASMGADPLDRPGFRKYQDLTKEEVSAVSDVNLKDISIPVNGRQKKLGKLLGTRATVIMNVKLDDPETTIQVPALRSMVAQYAENGLSAICFPTDQGDYEPDDSTTVRIKVPLNDRQNPPSYFYP